MIAPNLRRAALALAAGCCALSLTGGAGAADQVAAGWPQYRGPARTGISEETGLLKSWTDPGPKVVWKAPLGEGFSGISVVGDRLYTMYGAGEDDILASFSTADGKEVWKLRVDKKWIDDVGNGPRATPTVYEDVVYALSGRGRLVAVKSASGEKIWETDLTEKAHAKIPHWGISTSPLVEDDMLILDAGGGGNKSVVAVDRKTGAIRWTAYSDDPGYSAPLAVEIGGVRQVLSFAGSSLVSVTPADGKVLWSVPWKTPYNVNAAMPIFMPPDKVFISSSYDTGAAVYQVTKGASGFSTTEVWKSRVMKNHFNSSVFYKGYLYGFDDRNLKCIDAATGMEKWKQTGFNKGSLLLADGRLIIFSEQGLLAMAEASPDAYKEQGRAQILDGRTWTMPTLAGKKLYLRNEKVMVALEMAG